jgi:beta-glucanase (GH16 family)
LPSLVRHLACLALLSLALGCASPPAPVGERWQLVWSDEFDYTGHPDAAKWRYEKGFVRNNERQHYTVGRLENARVENGTLILEARRDGFQGHEYTSASITTRGTASWTYGRFEMRAKIPTGVGIWPSFWMLGTNIDRVGWPACGEIDIMDYVGFDPGRIHGGVHTKAFNHAEGTGRLGSLETDAPHQSFHRYAVEWGPERIDFLFDGTRYFTYANSLRGWKEWPFDEPQYLLMNVAVGGDWGGQQGIDDTLFPQRMVIDYVRVYRSVRRLSEVPMASIGDRVADAP